MDPTHHVYQPGSKVRARQKKDQNRLLSAYRQCGVLTPSCQSASVGRRTHYQWLANDEEYARQFKEAAATADDRLLTEIRNRALDSDKRDTVALIVALKMRGLFIERREVSGPDGGPQQIQHVMTDEDKKIAERIANRRLATVN